MAEIVGSLFGITPDLYQQQQALQADRMALEFAKLDPFESAKFAIGRGAYGLAGALGGALGAQDPQLQLISQRNAISKQINYNDPASIMQGVELLSQGGDTVGAMQLADVARKLQSEMAQTFQRTAAGRASLAQAAREQKQATPEKVQLAQALASRKGEPGSPEYEDEYTAQLNRLTSTEKPEAMTPEMRNAAALALTKGPIGSPEYSAEYNAQLARLTQKAEARGPSVGGDREAVSLEMYDTTYDKLTSAQRAAVNARVEQEQSRKAAAGAPKVTVPGVTPVFDVAGMRNRVQETIKPQLSTISASEQALESINDSIRTNNFISFNAARTQLARALGDSQLSRRDIEQAGGDPSIFGSLVDLTSRAFTSTPSIDTQKKIKDTLSAINRVARRQATAEINTQIDIATRTPGADPAAIRRALTFNQLQGGMELPSAGGDLAAQAAAELARRRGGK